MHACKVTKFQTGTILTNHVMDCHVDAIGKARVLQSQILLLELRIGEFHTHQSYDYEGP